MRGAITFRRRWFLGGMVSLIGIDSAAAMGRFPLGGELLFHLPHDTSSLDPYDLHDPLAALLGPSVFEPIFRLDQAGNAYPSLAEDMPIRTGSKTRIRLREGLQSAKGSPLLARDIVESMQRARRSGGQAVLFGIPQPTVDNKEARTAVFADTDPMPLARALASPLVVLSSRTSSPGAPDGTGAFLARPGVQNIVLERNTRAARGPAFLQRIRIARAADMRASLRAFEAKKADLGWLGAGLHQSRKDATTFDFGSVGWIVLRTGREAGSWDSPGVAQRLVDGMAPERLAHLALGSLPPASSSLGWGGPACKLFTPARSAHLMEVGIALASILSQKGHEVEALPLATAEFNSRRASRSFALMVDIIRPVGPAGMATLVALATSDDPARAQSIVQHPPRYESFDPRLLTRTLRLGVVGNLRVTGAFAPAVRIGDADQGEGWDLGNSYRRR